MIDLDRLKASLMTSGLQQKDNALFQVISQLIDAVRQFVIQTNTVIGGGGGGGGSITNPTYLTVNNETGQLPNSRQLLAGEHISFDDSIPAERTVNGSEWSVLTDGNPSAGYELSWDVLSNGDPVTPELIFAGGEVIMVAVRNILAPGIVYADGDVIMTEIP